MAKVFNRVQSPSDYLTYLKKNKVKTYSQLNVKEANGKNPIKDCIRDTLMKNQLGACGYCGRSLSREIGSIEHLNPQSAQKGDSLEFGNFLLSCPQRFGTCNHYRGSKPIYVTPYDANWSEIHVEINGTYDFAQKSDYEITFDNLNIGNQNSIIVNIRRNKIKEISEFIQNLEQMTDDEQEIGAMLKGVLFDENGLYVDFGPVVEDYLANKRYSKYLIW